jgi:hypothetical protein
MDDNNEIKLQIPKQNMDMIFWLDNKERIRIAEDGEFYVEGRRVTSDERLYEAFKALLVGHSVYKEDHKITYDDLGWIISTAKSRYVGMSLPMKISKKLATDFMPTQVLLIEALITYLASRGLLRADVAIDYDSRK